MDGLISDIRKSFRGLPEYPSISLRGANALDNYEAVPAFDPSIDEPTPEYFEQYFWGIAHLDSESWRFYLPHLLIYALNGLSKPNSNAIDALLSSLTTPDRDPPRFGSLSKDEESSVVAVLDILAFSEDSEWKEQAMVALEEYWGPGATYR